MKIHYNTEQLRELLRDFHYFTGATVNVFDSDFRTVTHWPEKMPRFCEGIRQDEARLTNCLRSDREAAFRAVQQREPITYICHAGLCEIVVPIFYGEVTVGYLLLGQFSGSDAEQKQRLCETCEKYGLDPEDYGKRLKELPSMDERRMHAAARILQTAVSYLWAHEILRLEQDVLASRLQHYIAGNLSADLSVAALCSRFYVNTKRLYRCFMKNFGCSVKDYVTARRMEEASRLLLSTGDPVSEIAAKTGYADYNYFIKVFRRAFGTTPLRYRKTALKNELRPKTNADPR